MSTHGCSQFLLYAKQRCLHATSQFQILRSLSSAAGSPSSRWAFLSSRGVLLAEGAQTLEFLQGIVSNDVRPLSSAGPQQPPVYASILTPKGKFLHDVFIHPHPEQRDAVLIDVDRNGAAAALQLLNRYKLRRPIKIQDVSGSYRVVASWGGGAPPAGPWWRPDPRLPDLGVRGLVPAAAAAALGEAAAGGAAAAAAEEDEYRALRYSLGVAEGETEIPAGSAAPLDYNVDVLNGVSYTKGCYVGQERNSFTHYRGIIRRRLMPVKLERVGAAPADGARDTAGQGPSSAAVECGAEVADAATGRSVGQLRGAVLLGGDVAAEPGAVGPTAGWGIAYLKLDVALPAAEGRGS